MLYPMYITTNNGNNGDYHKQNEQLDDFFLLIINKINRKEGNH